MSTPTAVAAGERCRVASRAAKLRKAPDGRAEFPPAESSGYLVRDAHRAFQRLLERRIAAYGLKRGQWYFLRVLWTEDGLSQRELSARVGQAHHHLVDALAPHDLGNVIDGADDAGVEHTLPHAIGVGVDEADDLDAQFLALVQFPGKRHAGHARADQEEPLPRADR